MLTAYGQAGNLPRIDPGQQVVDVPVHFFTPAMVTGDSGAQVFLSGSHIDVPGCFKLDLSQRAHGEAAAPLAWAWGFVLTGDDGYLELVRGSLPVLLQFPPFVRVPEGANIPFLYQA